MRPSLLLLLIVLAPLQVVRAQETRTLRSPALGAFDVVALMVEFQPDTSRFSTGNGIFAGPLFDDLEPKVDPLPHDHAYFEAHLEFLRNYVRRVSDGRAEVRTHLLPDVVRVSQPMGAYAPTGAEADAPEQRARLARLIEEAWTLADAEVAFDPGGLDPTRTAYVIFHAGVGRDIELTGTTLDRTPEDLPSLFFGPQTLDALLPGSHILFKGLHVDQSLIIPRTETRRGVDFISDEPFLIELSINGMLAASFFNYLGVPDLFNTATGQSAIGPFGLMDPLGIFAYGGLFPPEPSGWTRYYLGWVDPIEINGPEAATLALETSSRFGISDLARVWVSESEYFLLENRHRDPESDGVRLTVVNGDARTEVRFENAADGFSGPDVSAFPGGVVVDVDNYDWALPGGVDEQDRALMGGMLIWHIDERVIRQGLSDNTVNAMPTRRGVDLEEADSGQDLGFPSENPFAPQADLGSPFDFWYEGNPTVVVNQAGREIALYENRFGPATYPSSRTNDGGDSFIVLEDFGPPGPDMSFSYRRSDGTSARKHSLPFAPSVQETMAMAAFVPRATSVWHFDSRTVVDVQGADGEWMVMIADPSGNVGSFETRTPSVPAGLMLAWIGEGDAGLERVLFDPESNQLSRLPLPGSGDARVAGPMVSMDGALYALVQAGEEVVLFSMIGTDVQRTPLEGIGQPVSLTAAITSASGATTLLAVGTDGAMLVGPGDSWSVSAQTAIPPTTVIDEAGLLAVVGWRSLVALTLLEEEGTVTEVVVNQATAPPSVLDYTGDGHAEVLVPQDSLLYGYNRSGAVARGFPIRTRGRIGGTAVMGRDGQDRPILFIPLANGSIEAFVRDERGIVRLPGFPVSAGRLPVSLALVPPGNGTDDGILYAMTESGLLHAWQVPLIEEVVWPGLFGGAERTSFLRVAEADDAPAPADGRLLVQAETYNWPNPIRTGATNLRCMTREDSRIVITIIDGAGSLVDELTLESARAGVPSEVRWETNASSGLYFARVRATSTTGREDTHVIKMAVIR